MRPEATFLRHSVHDTHFDLRRIAFDFLTDGVRVGERGIARRLHETEFANGFSAVYFADTQAGRTLLGGCINERELLCNEEDAVMVRAAMITGLIATAMTLAGCRRVPDAEPPQAVVIAPAPAIAEREAMRKAARQVLTSDCGLSVFDPGYAENDAMLKQAGPAVVPVLTEMIAEKDTSGRFVAIAATMVSEFPYSEPFRQALRGRRDDPYFKLDHGCKIYIFQYFASYGDETDLVWMEKAIDSLDESRRLSAVKSVRKLRHRLEK